VGLQEEAAKTGSLLAAASESGRFSLAPQQSSELRDRLSDILWYVALLCAESGIPLQAIAANSVAQLQTRARNLDPDSR
jgi:NTP pyrophosphatase (non-canonical NTP hydrolase)